MSETNTSRLKVIFDELHQAMYYDAAHNPMPVITDSMDYVVLERILIEKHWMQPFRKGVAHTQFLDLLDSLHITLRCGKPNNRDYERFRAMFGNSLPDENPYPWNLQDCSKAEINRLPVWRRMYTMVPSPA